MQVNSWHFSLRTLGFGITEIGIVSLGVVSLGIVGLGIVGEGDTIRPRTNGQTGFGIDPTG